MCFTQLPVGCITGAAALTPDKLAKAWRKFDYMYTYHAYRGVHTKQFWMSTCFLDKYVNGCNFALPYKGPKT